MRSIGQVNALRAPIAIFAALGAVSIAYPQWLGNGLDIVQLSVLGQFSFGLLAVLLVLKPLATAACLGSGSPGGLFTRRFKNHMASFFRRGSSGPTLRIATT